MARDERRGYRPQASPPAFRHERDQRDPHGGRHVGVAPRIFMVSARPLTVGGATSICRNPRPGLDQDREPLTIALNGEGKIFLQTTQMGVDELVAKLKAISEAQGGGFETRIYVRGDRRVDYGTVMKVMGRISAAGFHRVALVTEDEQGP
jgi:biopolymer transport protein TolR